MPLRPDLLWARQGCALLSLGGLVAATRARAWKSGAHSGFGARAGESRSSMLPTRAGELRVSAVLEEPPERGPERRGKASCPDAAQANPQSPSRGFAPWWQQSRPQERGSSLPPPPPSSPSLGQMQSYFSRWQDCPSRSFTNCCTSGSKHEYFCTVGVLSCPSLSEDESQCENESTLYLDETRRVGAVSADTLEKLVEGLCLPSRAATSPMSPSSCAPAEPSLPPSRPQTCCSKVPSPPSWAPGWTSTQRTSVSSGTFPASRRWWPTCSSTCLALIWSAVPTFSWPSWRTWSPLRQSPELHCRLRIQRWLQPQRLHNLKMQIQLLKQRQN
ncbi:uncharacterized protein LOC131393757 [Diceros bicornis minor]|uniref:uncharacterized protein LOC131393757 n=1 Tax=Diceros bicornis minor TaxID=77932 RepID=UPI0026F160FA|nr:uncharacterized protein LOC131393757 [Diceros bicornis minor]